LIDGPVKHSKEQIHIIASNGVNSPSIQFDGFGPLPLHSPTSPAAVGDLVRQARSEKQAVYALGGGTHLSLGCTPSRPGIVIATTALNQMIDYPARDMTITVQAGMRMQTLQNLLATEKQRLPIDVPLTKQATIGGLLAANVSGPRRFGSGTLRDYLIGVTFVNDDGQEIKSGGRVVKNVAGYDMCKLLVGSLGTLGIITQATLKLRPMPEAQALILVPVALPKIAQILELVHGSQTRPACVEFLNPTTARCAGIGAKTHSWMLVVGFEDNESSVRWQIRKFHDELQAAGFAGSETLEGPGCHPAWQALIDFSIRPYDVFRVRISLPAEKMAELPAYLMQQDLELEVQAHVGDGVGHVQVNTAQGQKRCTALLAGLREWAIALGGFVVLEACPVDWKANLSVWGPSRNDFWLMRRIKEKLDPDCVFSPGRFVDGI
jgi:glycolate oxidase FAD binding subunit